MTSAQRKFARTVIVLKKLVDEPLVVVHLTLGAALFEDVLEVGDRRALREHFVVNVAQKGFVDELRRADVRGEDDEQRNGSSNFCPLFRVRKSTRLSSGTIQRFKSSRAEHRCRPKSSITNTPPLATA